MAYRGAVGVLIWLSLLAGSLDVSAKPLDDEDEGSTPLPYVGEIRWVAFSYPPRGWAICHGQYVGMTRFRSLLNVIQNLFGDQKNDMFALPNLLDESLNGTETLSEDEVQTLVKGQPLIPIIALEGALPTSPRYPIIHPDKKFSIDAADLDNLDAPEIPEPPLDPNIDQTVVEAANALTIDDPKDLPLSEKMYK